MEYRGPRNARKRSKRTSVQCGRTYKRRYRLEFHDPEGKEYGRPTYGWKMAPGHLKTKRQLLEMDLRPAQPIQAQVLWIRGGKEAVAYLYDVNKAKPKKLATLAQIFALEKAWAARRTCPLCGLDVGYTIRTSLGCCTDCYAATPRGRLQNAA